MYRSLTYCYVRIERGRVYVVNINFIHLYTLFLQFRKCLYKIKYYFITNSYNKKADIYVAEDSNFNSNVLNSNLETKLTGTSDNTNGNFTSSLTN